MSPNELIDLGGPEAMAYQAVALGPFWRWVRTLVESDRALRGRLLADEGAERLLRSLHPTVSWEAPLLPISPSAESDVRLDGRGLVLQPSDFCWRAPAYR